MQTISTFVTVKDYYGHEFTYILQEGIKLAIKVHYVEYNGICIWNEDLFRQ